MDLAQALKKVPLDDLEELEDKLGLSLNQMLGEDVPKGKVFKGLYWLLQRTENPNLTWEEAGSASLGDVLDLAGEVLGDDEDPEEPSTESDGS